MASHHPKSLPRDPNQRAVKIGRILVGDEGCEEKDEGKDPAAVERGKKGGAVGGASRAAKMSTEERKEAARKAATARWKNRQR